MCKLTHTRRKVLNIGGRGGARFRILGRPRGAKRFTGCKQIGAPAPNQCRISTFFTLKTNNKAKLRIELKCILLEVPLNKIKGMYIKLVLYDLVFTVHIDIEGKCGWLIEGGGGNISKIIGEGGPGPPLEPLFLRLCGYREIVKLLYNRPLRRSV